MGQLFLKTGLSDDNISDKLIILHHHKKCMLIANTAVCFFSFTVISVMWCVLSLFNIFFKEPLVYRGNYTTAKKSSVGSQLSWTQFLTDILEDSDEETQLLISQENNLI